MKFLRIFGVALSLVSGLVLVLTSLVKAQDATPIDGIILPDSFTEVCSSTPQCVGPSGECCGSVPACIVYFEIDLNISEDPVPLCEIIPYISFASSGDGANHWEGEGVWHIDDDNFQCSASDDCLFTRSKGIWGRKSRVAGNPAVGKVEISYFVIGGTGKYENAQGTFQGNYLQEGTESGEGSVHGVVRVP